VRASVLAPAGSVLESRWPLAGPVAVSPDGTRLVFTARKGEGVAQLWVRALDDTAPHPLPGTDGATLPFWSPDGRFVAFAADGKLRKVDVNGGPVSVICDVPDSRGATWNRDDVILFSPEASSPIFSVPAGGGTPRAVTTLSDGDTTHRYPYFLPDGKHFLYLARKTYSGPGREPAIRVGELGSKVSKKVVDAASNAVYASGFLLYVLQGNLVAQPFDSKKLVTTGEPSPVVDGVRIDDRFSRAVFSVSDNGVLACQTGKAVTATQFVWLDRTGRELGRLGEPAEHFNGGYPVLSPDGKRLAGSALDPGTGLAGVWLVDLASGARTRLSTSTMDSYSSAWSPDGARLAMRRSPVGSAANARLVVRSIDGSGLEQELGAADGSSWISPVSWSPDGAFLLEEIGSGGGGTGNTHLAAVPVAGGPSVKLSLSQGHENMGQFSPDGRLVAYVSDESGRRDVYVAAFPGPGGKWQVSQDGGTEPRWRRDGKELFFFAPDNRLMAAEVTLGGGAFQVGAITPLFQTRAMGSGYRYDAAPDGRRFLVNTALPDTSSPEITLLLNWPEALRRP
jgi:Tol biopolymer transport system component